MRLVGRVTLLVTATAIVALTVTGYFAMRIALDAAYQAHDEGLRRDAERLGAFADTWLVGQRDALAGWVVPFATRDDTALETHLLRAVVQAVPSARRVAWFDASTPGPWPVEAALSARDAALAEDPLAVGMAFGAPRVAAGRVEVPVALAGPRQGQRLLGAWLDLEPVQNLLDQAGSEGKTVVLLDGAGQILWHSGADGAEPTVVDAAELARVAATGVNSRFSIRQRDDRFVRGALARLGSLDWTIAVFEPAEAAAGAGQAIRSRTLVILAVSTILAAAIGGIVGRSLVRPVVALRDGALAVSEGQLGLTVPVVRQDELGELSDAFNYMSSQLLAQHTEIDAFNRDLQARVEERTRDLQQAQAHLVESGQRAAVAELSAGLAHELNNPLAAILGLAQILRARSVGQEAVLLAKMEEQASRCREVVASMMRLAGAEGAAGAIVVIDLRTVLSEVVALVAVPYRHSGLEITLQPTDRALNVHFDPVAGARALAQVFHRIRVGLEPGARLRVHGSVGEATIDVHFEVQGQERSLDDQDDRKAAALGWWVARQVIERLGGRLEECPVASQGAEGGPRWIVALPRPAVNA